LPRVAWRRWGTFGVTSEGVEVEGSEFRIGNKWPIIASGRFFFDALLFFRSEAYTQLRGHGLGDVSLDCKDIRQFSIVTVGPKGLVTSSSHEPDYNPNAITTAPHRTFD
jgi:hypothetical protein